MTRFRITIALAVLTAALAVAVPSQAAVTKLTGTVGPGFTITLSKAGKRVLSLPAGTYSITIADKSNIHNWHLRGPGRVNREITGIGFVGTKTAIVKLVKGTYTYICDPHLTTMKRTFKVT